MKKKSNCAWLKLDYNFMTDESEYEDEDGEITVHQHFYLGDHKVQGTILIAGTIKFVGLNK